MYPYWLLLGFFASGALLGGDRLSSPTTRRYPFLALGALLVALLIGLRYQVGADWETYDFLFRFAGRADLGRLMEIGDPGYQLLNWLVQVVGGDIWLVNLVGGAFFAWGMLRLAQAQPDPWLAFLVGVPYLVLVVAMGYSRQAVAIGILMAGLASFERGGSLLRFSITVAFAALFHKTAVIVLPLVIFASERNRLLNAIAGVAVFVLMYDLFLADSVDKFVSNYIEAEYNSQGAAIRVAMNLLPATLYLLSQKRFGFPPREEKVWRYFSIAAWVCLALLLVLPSSTAVDRLALYIAPLQVAVLSRVPLAYASRGPGKLAVVLYCFLIQFTWLNFAAHAEHWIPYQLYPLWD